MLILGLACSAAAGGCAGLRPQLVQASVQKPGNVAVYFTVDTDGGDPVPGLTAEQFHIYEDDKLVSMSESKQTILNPEVAAMHYTLLLVDMSGSVTKSGSLPQLEEAVNKFTERVGKWQQTAIYGFDGRPDLVPIRGFGSGSARVSMTTFHTQDPSTNLYGAVIKATKVLEKQLEHSPVPLRFGTLVVFTDGTDQAHRNTADEMRKALSEVNYDVFVIGVGAEINEGELREIGKNGAALSKNPAAVGASYDQIAARIEGFTKRFYLLSYCSPSRAGEHDLAVEPFTPNGKKGQLSYHFKADGFGPECDPNRKPNFDIRHPRAGKGTQESK
jgi:hypothetical protein